MKYCWQYKTRRWKKKKGRVKWNIKSSGSYRNYNRNTTKKIVVTERTAGSLRSAIITNGKYNYWDHNCIDEELELII
jgi:hypothetical protein|tara:strand:+ start:421 stop:651 length:231 start_codon:yes stop_codon:yes gene_type:complete